MMDPSLTAFIAAPMICSSSDLSLSLAFIRKKCVNMCGCVLKRERDGNEARCDELSYYLSIEHQKNV